ncbi:hypothetical protein GF343_03290 [Candidatus Woesearchaeota archaeon]|nr:hypothetical protein [Candidatus Woesearchaeota archaeon]
MKCSEYFNICYTAYYRKDQELASKLISSWPPLDAQGRKLLNTHGLAVCKLLELLTLCRNFSGHIVAQHYISEFE